MNSSKKMNFGMYDLNVKYRLRKLEKIRIEQANGGLNKIIFGFEHITITNNFKKKKW